MDNSKTYLCRNLRKIVDFLPENTRFVVQDLASCQKERQLRAAGAPLELTVVTGEIMMPSTVHSSPTLVTVRQRSFTAAAGLFTLKGFLHYCFRCWLILPPLSWVAPTTLTSTLLLLPCLYRLLLKHKEERTAKSTRTTTQIKKWLWSVHVLLTFLHRERSHQQQWPQRQYLRL